MGNTIYFKFIVMKFQVALNQLAKRNERLKSIKTTVSCPAPSSDVIIAVSGEKWLWLVVPPAVSPANG